MRSLLLALLGSFPSVATHRSYCESKPERQSTQTPRKGYSWTSWLARELRRIPVKMSSQTCSGVSVVSGVVVHPRLLADV
jgi:hypothetical protein